MGGGGLGLNGRGTAGILTHCHHRKGASAKIPQADHEASPTTAAGEGRNATTAAEAGSVATPGEAVPVPICACCRHAAPARARPPTRARRYGGPSLQHAGEAWKTWAARADAG